MCHRGMLGSPDGADWNPEQTRYIPAFLIDYNVRLQIMVGAGNGYRPDRFRERWGMSRFTQTVCTACLLLLLSGTVVAEQIYRSVDADGNVTFSSTPPANAAAIEEVSVRPGPSPEAQREARARIERQQATASEMGEARADRTRQQPAASPAASDAVVREVPVDQYPGYPYPNTSRRDQARDRLPARPVQLPARPVPR